VNFGSEKSLHCLGQECIPSMRGHSSPWLLPTEEIFGVIRALNPFRLTGASRDYIVLPGMDLLNGAGF